MVEHDLAMVETGVRFSSPAPILFQQVHSSEFFLPTKEPLQIKVTPFFILYK